MCAYFEQDLTSEDVTHLLDALGLAQTACSRAHHRIRPTDPALVVDASGPRDAHFGLVRRTGSLLLNARIETLEVRPTFAPLLAAGRALVPMSGFDETGLLDGRRTRLHFLAPSQPLLALALVDAGDRFVLVTRAAPERWSEFHDRMPAFVATSDARAWLTDGTIVLDEPTLAVTRTGSNGGRHPGQAAL